MASTQSQFSAIQNKANSNSLVSQLFAGAPKNPANPFATAASSKVASPTAPSNTGYGTNGAPMSVVPTSTPAPVQSTIPSLSQAGIVQSPPNQPVKKQTVTTASGDTHTTEYHPPATPENTASASGTQPNPAYIPGSIGPGNLPTIPAGSQTPPQMPQNGTGTVQTPVVPPTPAPSPFASNAQPAATGAQGLFNTGQGIASDAEQALLRTQAQIKAAQTQEGNMLSNMQGNPIPLEFQQGRGNIQQANFNSGLNALETQQATEAGLLGTGLGAQGTGVTGLNAAGALSTPANKFLQVPYSNQVLDANGQPVGGGTTGTLPPAAQTFVTSLADAVKSGNMTRPDAESELQAYGTAGLQALNTALGGSSFNTNASNASAGTTATGQQIQTAADSTNKALDTLSSSFNSLSNLQTGGIPLTNNIAQWIGSNLGDAALTQYKTNLADARSQLIGVLNSSGGTPTGNESTANEYLPDNMTPAQFQQNVGTAQNPGIVRQLIQQKVSSFTNSGQQNGQSTSPITWDSIVK